MLGISRHPILKLIAILAITAKLASSAIAFELVLHENFQHQSVGEGLEYIEDKQHQYTFRDVVKQGSWQINKKHSLNFGLTNSVYWSRFQVTNQSSTTQDLIFESNYAPLDNLEIFIQRNESFEHFKLGDSIPFSKKLISHANHLAPIALSPMESVTLIIRAQTNGGMQIPINIWEEHAYIKANYTFSTYYGIFYGILFAAACYHLLLYFSLKERSFLFFSLVVSNILIAFLCIGGFPNAFFWPNSNIATEKVLILSIFIAIYASCRYSNEVLLVKQSRPMWGSILELISNISITVALLSLFLPYKIGLLLALPLGFFCASACLIVYIIRFMDGYPPAKFTLAAGACGCIAVILKIIVTAGLLPNTELILVSEHIGITTMVLIYAYTLSYRMNLDRAATEIAQKLAYKTTKQSLETKERLNIDLDRLVVEITREKDKVTHMLKATKEMSSCENKIVAGQYALNHLCNLFDEIEPHDMSVLFPNKNSNTLTEYPIWEDGHEITKSIGRESDPNLGLMLSQVKTITLQENILYIPVRSEKTLWAYLLISHYQNSDSQNSLDIDLVDNIALTLAHTLESFDAEEKNRLSMIGGMAAAIVHDLKNPIGAIQVCAELAADNATSIIEREDFLATIIEESRRMSIIAHEVLEISRDKIILEQGYICTTEFIDDISRTLTQVFAPHGILYESHCEFTDTIKMDIDRVRRVLLNLATNASDAMEQCLKADSKFTLSLIKMEEGVAFIAKDNGPGIPESIQATLFEPFVTHGKVNGTGLGMAIVKKVVDAHDGTISFTSELSQGTSFEVYLPNALTDNNIINDNQSPVDSHNTEHTRNFQKKKVLLVDDNAVNKKVISKLLTTMGLEVVTASDGQQAVEKVLAEPFDFVLMDVEMPVMDGYDATIAIRKYNQYEKLPIIALTGHSSQEQINKCLASGMDSVLHKPIGKRDLNIAIGSLFKP